MKWLLLILILAIGLVQGKKCPGFCTSDVERCKRGHGKIIGYCTDEKACCDPLAGLSGTCGAAFSNLSTAFFKSPQFPAKAAGDLNCHFRLKLDPGHTQGLRIHFLVFESDGLRHGHGKACDSDMFLIKGFGNWAPPPRCGNLTGYSTWIELGTERAQGLRELSLVCLMSSPAYRWHIRVDQISNSSLRQPLTPARPSAPTAEEDEGSYRSDAYGPVSVHPKLALSALDFETSEEEDQGFETRSIVNGEGTEAARVPWQASLRLFYSTTNNATLRRIKKLIGDNCSLDEGIHFCGGSVIDHQHILSAAHCFFGTTKVDGMVDLSVLKVVLGDSNRCRDGDQAELNATSAVYDVESVSFHYAYDDQLIDSDIAVLRLKKRIQFGPNVQVLRLAQKGDDFVGERGTVSGWGLMNVNESDTELPHVLQFSPSFIVQNRTACRRVLEASLGVGPDQIKAHMKYRHVYEGVFCTGTHNSSRLEVLTGQGDSGGAFVVDRNGSVQAGIVSYALSYRVRGGNKTENLDFFQSVSFYSQWIRLITNNPVPAN